MVTGSFLASRTADLTPEFTALARDRRQTAADTKPTRLWPSIHPAALPRPGWREAQQAHDEQVRRHPSFMSGRIKVRIPSQEAARSELRSRLIASLQEPGMRDWSQRLARGSLSGWWRNLPARPQN